MKSIILFASLFCSTLLFAGSGREEFIYGIDSGRGEYHVRIRPISCLLGHICHSTEYRKAKVYYESRLITFTSYQLRGDKLYAKFIDIRSGRTYIQKGCPSIIKKINKTYNVMYDPYKNVYFINCNHFGD